MYQSISVRVLRQAMDWMSIPSPWFRTVSAFTFPNGDYSSIIKCMWNFYDVEAAIEQYICECMPIDGAEQYPTRSEALRAMLYEAFCEDIQVVSTQYLPEDRLFVAYLSCKVSRHCDLNEALK